MTESVVVTTDSSTPAPILLHHLKDSRSERLFWFLEETNLHYDVKVWYRQPTMAAPKELVTIHPLGKSPILQDQGKTYAESGHILDHLIHAYPSNCSSSLKTFNEQANYWSHYAEGGLMLFLQMTTTFDATMGFAPWFIKPIISAFVDGIKKAYLLKEVQKAVDFLESELSKSSTGWIAQTEEPSTGDFMLLYPIHSLLNSPKYTSTLTIGPSLKAWLEKVEARPGYKKGLERMKEEEVKQKVQG